MSERTIPTLRDLSRVPLYAPSPLEGVTLDLRDNTNLWGTPPSALAAVRRATLETLRNYPDVSVGTLAETLAEQLGVGRRNIVVGCGSDDIIDASLSAVVEPRSRVAHADPSFSMLPNFARLRGLVPVGVPLTSTGAMNIDGLLATKAPLIYVCSPNNPTGTVTPREELLRLFDHAPGIVLLDEAYGEFTDAHDLRAEAARRENVLVTRTFSKAWGLAGLRIGYGVGGEALVAAVTKARGPYKVTAVSESAAVHALRHDAAWLKATVQDARRMRDRLHLALQGRDAVRVWASEGNFVFLQLADSAAAAAERFRERGIGVRAFSNLNGIGEALRVGLAPWEQLQRVVDAAEEIFA
jgi:histidinol-phosphate aminotransferase